MIRQVSAHLEVNVTAPADIVWSVAVAESLPITDEELTVTVDGQRVTVRELSAAAGTRLHLTAGVPTGELALDYRATVDGVADGLTGTALEDVLYRRPSRYCDSDTLAPVAAAEFGSLDGKDLLDAVSSWVGQKLSYISGSSRPTDGAVHAFLGRRGVCRDYAHLVVSLMRARNVPARLVSAYAPGLRPMDFHAVAEALIDGQWNVVDATAMAPRQTLLRIATGRDAADTAFMTVQRGLAQLNQMSVVAVSEDDIPTDDVAQLTHMQ